jgi:ABC-type transport system involved in multi-copper enzyme maturation permease subunit
MDAPDPKKAVRIQRWLPYWAVFQADVQQTLRSWVYRVWLAVTVLAAAGYLLYRYAPYQEAGIIQNVSTYLGDLLRWTVVVSAGLVVVLTAGTISSERGTMADSVLSRGISRHQYFLGKWHARLATVLGTYLLTGLAALVCGTLLLNEDLKFTGCCAALGAVAAVLTAVITFGVTVSAVVNSTVVGIAVLWLFMYGGGFVLALLPSRFPAPVRMVQNLPNLLRGQFDSQMIGQIVVWSLAASVVAAGVGMIHFARRDV